MDPNPPRASDWSELWETAKELTVREPQEIRRLRTGDLPRRPGSYGQYFTTWDFINAILRDYSMNVYQCLRMATNEKVGFADLLVVLETLDPVYSEYLADTGFENLGAHARLVRALAVDRTALVNGLTAFSAYINRLTAWSHHYFPWDVGQRFTYPAGAEAGSPRDARQDPYGQKSREKVRIRLHWEPLNIQVRAYVYADLNVDLCREFLRALPFRVLQDHAVVTGRSMYAWTPLVSVAPVPVRERITEAPTGRLRYSQNTGNKLVVQYGRTSEGLSAPVLGAVAPEHLDILREAGEKVWSSTYHTKDLIWLTVAVD